MVLRSKIAACRILMHNRTGETAVGAQVWEQKIAQCAVAHAIP